MKVKRVLLSAMALFALTGCLSHIPDKGAVSFGAEAYAPSTQNFVRTLVLPPTVGVTAQGLIREFLAAIAGDQGDYLISRLYLAPEVRNTWRPETGVRIYADRLQSVYSHAPRNSNVYVFSGSKVGTIDEQGHYQRSPAEELLFENFSLRQVGGEWRISSLEDGLALSSSDVARSYRQLNIYFLNISKHSLVPDSVYLPVNLGVSTALIRALLAGPTRWLSPSVTTAIPFGTSLMVGSVPIQQGVARVDLSSPTGSISSSDRQALSAQIVWTLKQLAEVAAVRITVDRAPLIVAGSGEAQSRFSYASFSPDVLVEESPSYVVGDRGLSRVVGLPAKPTLMRVQSGVSQELAQFRAAALSLDGNSLAGITAANSLVSGPLTGPYDLRITGPTSAKWLAPSWDSDGNLWAARVTGAHADVFLITPEGRTISVVAANLVNRNVQGFRIARDGSRVAFAIGNDESSRLYLARVIRLGIGMDPKFRIEEPIELPWSAGSIGQINWADATHLVVLTSNAPRAIWTVALDASEEINLAGIVDPLVIAAAPGMPVLAVDSRGKLSALVGQSWQEIGTGRYPLYAG